LGCARACAWSYGLRFVRAGVSELGDAVSHPRFRGFGAPPPPFPVAAMPAVDGVFKHRWPPPGWPAAAESFGC